MKIKGFVILFGAIICSSCSNKFLSGKLDTAESVINERPDSTLAIIKSIDTLSLNSKAMKARYSLLHAMALDKNYIDTTDVNIVMPAVEYYQKHGGKTARV